ncbi:MAG: GMC family oxidoreductase [Desulfobacterales bacterium]|nr:GMC family oxidoreductase [Desulfobacterales bacterium]
MNTNFDYDYIIVGSGFGGSVSALRLAEKGYKVAVIEQGKRFKPEDFPTSNWNVKNFFWLPKIGCYGIQQLTLLPHAFILHGAGVGGGSLVYACTLFQPEDEVLRDPEWNKLEDWEKVLKPKYDQVRKMLGATKCPVLFESDKLLEETVKEIRPNAKSYTVDVGIHFGEQKKTVPDPYFNGEGPERAGCDYCGSCMTGCRNNAKNTLDKNYLYFAEKLGVKIIPEHEVTKIEPISKNDKKDGSEGYNVEIRKITGFFGPKKTYTSQNVICSAGVIGTNKLLQKMKSENYLPNISEKLGEQVRTNSETLTAAAFSEDKKIEYSKGIAISGYIKVDDDTTLETVRYGKGHDAMCLVATEITDDKPPFPRWLRWIFAILLHPIALIRRLISVGWANSTIILLLMQKLDNSFKLVYKLRFPFLNKRLTSELVSQKPAPTYIPIANEITRKLSQKITGTPQSTLPESLLNVSATAHILGGCPMAENASEGVIDKHCNVFGYKNLKVIDGSMVPVNLGVNPALTIAALAEYAMENIKPK